MSMDTTEPKPDASSGEPIEPTIDSLQDELARKHDAYLRALAEVQNIQRRSIENEARARHSGIVQVANSLVPVLENMDLALAQDLSAMEPAKLAAAVTMLRAELLKAIERHGIVRIDPARGDAFDPHCHQAVMQQAADGVAPGCVVQCFQSGYRLGDHILRSAKVVVSPSE
jgi:molecular chaperone GrpE